MRLLDGDLIVSPTDLTSYLACRHLAIQRLLVAEGCHDRPSGVDSELEVLLRRGDEHEQLYLDQLTSEGLSIGTIPRPENSTAGLVSAVEQTRSLMREGVDVIYQATFFDGRWVGHADFLRRVPVCTELGHYGYEVEDTKLARSPKPAAILQVCFYADQLARLQGCLPARGHLVLGDRSVFSFLLREYISYFRRVRVSFEKFLHSCDRLSYPEPVQHCSVCEWSPTCTQTWSQDEHLSMVAGLRRDQAKKLEKVGITTIRELALLVEDATVAGLSQVALEKLRRQAFLQMAEFQSGTRRYELLAPGEPGSGLSALPAPTPEDLFFDIEGDPFVGAEGLEYLLGVAYSAGDEHHYAAFWGHDAEQEKHAFEQFVDTVSDALSANPLMHVYHYASYEQTALKRLACRHGTREDVVDCMLRGGVFVDLFRVVRQGVRISAPSYSLKEVEPLYMGRRLASIQDAGSSIVAYELWLETGDQQILDGIEMYNREDCISTSKLRDWLEGLRDEAIRDLALSAERPPQGDPQPGEALAAEEADRLATFSRLTSNLPNSSESWGAEEHARSLLAHMLGWHRRESKSEWWGYFSRLEMTDEELCDDHEAIGGLEYEGVAVESAEQCEVHRYRFDPAQDHKILVGDAPVDPATERSAGQVRAVDSLAGTIDLKRSDSLDNGHPASLIPGPPLDTGVLRRSVHALAEWVGENGLVGKGPCQAVRRLLLNQPPTLASVRTGRLIDESESTLDAARRLVLQLDSSFLAIQGPPGSGKTYTGARMVIELVRDGKVAGITAISHKVITNLLREVCDAAKAADLPYRLRCIQKVPSEERDRSLPVRFVDSNQKVEEAVATRSVDVIAGTPWLFARRPLAGAVDVLFVDEAGQMSLANVVAVGRACESLVLLGDPQQLAQPSKGVHPAGCGISALEHVLAGRPTIGEDHGLFLDRSYRLHPDICSFVSEVAYEGRLSTARGYEAQRVIGQRLTGTGLRFMPVEHEGNRTSSVEEAAVVARELGELLGATWTDHLGEQRTIGLEDVLVVAPFNAHVACLRAVLPEGARVGTVDKFQGQEAPVVFYAMAASSADRLPRGLRFLFSLNRFNVAISRARCLSVLVCSPALMEVVCSRPEDMRLVNALCRFVEMAERIEAV